MTALTHKGWLLACPILAGDIDSDAPLVCPRRGVPYWWLEANGLVVRLWIAVRSLVQPGFDGSFPIVFTGALEESLQIDQR